MKDHKIIESSIRLLFQETFITNCKLDNIQVTAEQAKEVTSVNIFNLIENLKVLINSLLTFKQSSLSEEKSEIIQRNEQFENMLQKLEAEVRSHIRVEHQLKLHIETNQTQTEELENENITKAKELKALHDLLKSYHKGKSPIRSCTEHTEKIEMLENQIAKKDSIIYKLELDFVKLKTSFEKGNRDNSLSKMKIQKDYGRKQEIFDEIKGKIEQKNMGLQRIQVLLKQASATKIKDKRHKKKQSEGKLITNLINNSHTRSISEQIRHQSVSRRAPSH